MAIVESGPHVVDTKQAYIIVRHVKFQTKKSGKKVIKAFDAVKNAVPNESEAVKNRNKEEMPLQSNEWELIEGSSDTESDLPYGHVEEVDITLSQQKSSTSKPKPESFRPKLETDKAATRNSASPFVSTQTEPSVSEVNRYAKQSEPNKFHRNRERMPHQANRNGNDPRAQFDPRQRQLNNNTAYPNSPSSGHGRFSSTNPAAFGQRNSGVAGDKSRNPGPPQSYGVFNPSKPIPSSDQKNSGEITADQPRNTSSPMPSYGIFNAKKPAGSVDRSKVNSNADKPGDVSDPSLPTRSYGIFSAAKPSGSADQRISKNPRTSGSSGTPSYGAFSKP